MTRLSPSQTVLVNTRRTAGRVHDPGCFWLASIKVPTHGPLAAHYMLMLVRDVPAGHPCCAYCLKGWTV